MAIDIGSLVIGVLGSCLAAGIIALIRYLYGLWRDSRSDMAGSWQSEIVDESGCVVKSDLYKLRHNPRTNEVTGSIERVFPINQTHRSWKACGYLSGKWLLLAFWSKPPQMSSGCIYVSQVEDFHYRGHYIRTTNAEPETIGIDFYKAQC